MLSVGISFAVWNYGFLGEVNKIESGDIEIEFLESNTDIISIENALPMGDNEGKSQDKTFDFQVRTKTKNDTDIGYSLILERVQNLCGDLENPNKDDYPECYSVVISDTDKASLLEMCTNDWGDTEEDCNNWYQQIINGGVDGYGDDLDSWLFQYNDYSGETITPTYEFDNTKTYGNIEQLKDKDVKVYLEDYQGNILLEPTKVSDISSDYVIYTKINSHDSENENIKDKYKLRVWIDGETDASDWTATEKHQYKFKIGVKTKLKESDVSTDENPETSDLKYTVKYNANGGKGTMENSTFVYNQTGKLSKNTYVRDHYTFKGWSTKSTSNQVVYNDEAEVKNLTDVYHGIVNLYAVWEINSYDVNVVVQNGTVDTASKSIKYGSNGVFTISTNEGYNTPVVTCTNDQTGTISNNTLTVSNVTKDTTCKVTHSANTYQVRYNANGGYIPTELEMTSTSGVTEPDPGPMQFNFTSTSEGDNLWEKIGGVWRSGNYNIASSTSTLTSEEFTITEQATLSFEWAASSEDEAYDYLYYTIYKDGTALSDTGTDTRIGGNSDITDEANLTYTKVETELTAGTYTIEFTYKKDSSVDEGLDRGYVKNITISGPDNSDNMANSMFTYDVEDNLKSNEYIKQNYTFQGWSTSESGGTVNYQNGATIKNLTSENNKIVDLYAVWKINSYTVNVVVQNGTVDTASKNIKYQQSGTFNLTPTVSGTSATVTCTNSQTGSITNNTLTVSNVTNNTTCTVKYITEKTTLYTDGTLIINENLANRSSNITNHGAVTNEYEAMDEDNSYVFSSSTSMPWNNEKTSVTSMEIGSNIKPISTAYWAQGLKNMTTGDFTKLDASQVTDMSDMFYLTGCDVSTFNLIGLNNWDTSSVTSMSSMFSYAGQDATTWSIGDLSGWDTSSVIDMSFMFNGVGYSATTFDIGDLSGWDTSSVKNMRYMFWNAGSSATTFDISYIQNWNTSSVTDMSDMFFNAGYNATTFNIGDLSGWNTSSVTDMSDMFLNAGYSATTFNIGNLSNWNTSSVTDMYGMFCSAGYSATTFDIGDLSSWNTSSVTDMSYMFEEAGYNATTFNIGDLSGWDTSSVTYMGEMFYDAGRNATTWTIGDLSGWDTSSVTDMDRMFTSAGYNATTWSIGDLSSWDVSKVTKMYRMFEEAGYKAATFNIGDISSWDTSSVTDMENMFTSAGYNATTFNIGDLSGWNTSSVTNMSYMFSNAGYKATWSLDCSGWNVNKVTSYTGFNNGVESKVTAPTWVN